MELTKVTERLFREQPHSDREWITLKLDEDGDHFIGRVVRLEPRVEKVIPPPKDLFEWAEQEEAKAKGTLGVDPRPVVATDRIGVPLVHSARGPSWSTRNFLARIPESKLITRGRDVESWKIAATDLSVMILDRAWGRDQIVCDEEAQIVFDHLRLRFLQSDHRAKIQAEFKIDGVIPDPNGHMDHPDRPLADYQRIAKDLSSGTEGYALFMDKGTGKTAVGISRVMHETRKLQEERQFRVLVICPNQVRTNWREEFGRFATLPGKVTVMRGSHLKRIKKLTYMIKEEYPRLRWTALVAGIDTVVREQELLAKIPWDLVILDESHYIRNQNTKRHKAVMAIRDVSKSRLPLTGDPIANSPLDLWGQLEFLGRGMSGFMAKDAFAQFFGKWEVRGGRKTLTSLQNVPLLQERLGRFSFQITKEEAGLNLPDKVYDTYEVEMSAKQREVYVQVATVLKAELEGMSLAGPDAKMTVNHVLTRLLRLAQITSGFAKTDPVACLDTGDIMEKSKIVPFTNNPKLDAVEELIKGEDECCKVIIWSVFRENMRSISERLTAMGIEHGCYFGDTSEKKREEYKNRFNKDPKFRVLVAQPQTAAEGLDLLGYDKDDPDGETAGYYCGQEIYFSHNWSAVQRSQSEDRAHRRGTRMPVRITDLVVPGSIDEEIRRRVLGKQELAQMITDITEILENVLELQHDE